MMLAQAFRLREHVLVIDDDVLVRRIFERALSSVCDVTSVERAEDALALIDGGVAFDVVLCDLRLGPGLSGRELYDRVRERAPRQAARIIMMSGLPPTGADIAFGAAMARRWLKKPVHRHELIVMVAEVAASTRRDIEG